MNKQLCYKCGEKKEYIIKEKEYTYEEDGYSITYLGKMAVCETCGSEIIVDEVENYNQIQFEKAYQEQLKIISKKEIEKILEKYNIGKRPLSKVLGLGEITITRYLDGFIPNQKNSQLLKEILEKPEVYYTFLQKNKDSITELAYKKSMNKLKKLLNFHEDPLLLDVATYITHNFEVTNLTLQKLLYYIQVFYYKFHKKFLFSSCCGAWDHGPVYGKVYHKYKNYKSEIIIETDEIDLATDIKEIVHIIVQYFGCYNGNILSYFTHSETPWKEGYEQHTYITHDSLAKFADELDERFEIKCYEDIKLYTNALLMQYQSTLFSTRI